MIHVGLCHEEAVLNVKSILLAQGNPYCPWWGWVQWRSSALFVFMPSTFFFSCSKENLCWVRFHLWQWALHPSQVEMWWGGRVSRRLGWVRSSMQWVAHSGVSRHVLPSKHRETEALIPSTCRRICQFMLVLEQNLQTQKIQVIQITQFTNFQMYLFSRLWYRLCCLVWISVCKGIVNILSCLSGSWSAAVEKCHTHLGSGFLETQIWCFAW